MKEFVPDYNEAQLNWFEALLSGEYQQGKEWLRTGDDQYCCLGVACNVIGLVWDDTPKDYGISDPGSAYNVAEYDEEKSGERGLSTAPDSVIEALCLHSEFGDPEPTDGKHCNDSLTALNDEGKTFEEIVEIVKSAPERFFTNIAQQKREYERNNG